MFVGEGWERNGDESGRLLRAGAGGVKVKELRACVVPDVPPPSPPWFAGTAPNPPATYPVLVWEPGRERRSALPIYRKSGASVRPLVVTLSLSLPHPEPSLPFI